MTRFVPALRSLAFVYVAALIMAIGSERMFWFWSTGFIEHLEVAAYYSLATAAAVALMRRFHVTSWWSLMLVAPVVAFVVEGVITPIVYTGGPFVPVFPAWFTFWHGMFSLIGLVFVVRRLLLDEALLALAAVSIALGCFWGVWSSTLRLPENVNDPELQDVVDGPLRVLDPSQFARYAGVMTVVFIVSHAVLGFVWPRRSSSRSGTLDWRERCTLGLMLAGAAMWTVVAPWALPMFVGYCWIQLKGLRWHRSSTAADAPSLLDQLQGRVRVRALLPIALMAPSAALAYAWLWELNPSVLTLQIVMYGTIVMQGVAGFAVSVKALLRARRLSASAPSSVSSTSRRVPSPSR